MEDCAAEDRKQKSKLKTLNSTLDFIFFVFYSVTRERHTAFFLFKTITLRTRYMMKCNDKELRQEKLFRSL